MKEPLPFIGASLVFVTLFFVVFPTPRGGSGELNTSYLIFLYLISAIFAIILDWAIWRPCFRLLTHWEAPPLAKPLIITLASIAAGLVAGVIYTMFTGFGSLIIFVITLYCSSVLLIGGMSLYLVRSWQRDSST